jgi:hypothetical protein
MKPLKQKTLKALLIDPVAQSVTEVEYDGSLKAIYGLLNVSMIEAAYPFTNRDCVYVDEEGLFKLTTETKFVLFEGFHAPLAGRALVVGTSSAGNTISPKSKAADVTKLVTFLNIREAQAFRPDPNKWDLGN